MTKLFSSFSQSYNFSVFAAYSEFAVVMQMRLLEMLLEKETRAGTVELARKWLSGAMNNITEVGTFRSV